MGCRSAVTLAHVPDHPRDAGVYVEAATPTDGAARPLATGPSDNTLSDSPKTAHRPDRRSRGEPTRGDLVVRRRGFPISTSNTTSALDGISLSLVVLTGPGERAGVPGLVEHR